MLQVLIISHNETIFQQMAELLQAAGYRVTTVKRIHEGIALAKKEPPDCVIIDHLLEQPEKNNAREFFAARSGSGHLPVLIFYRGEEAGKLAQATDFQADDYISEGEGAGGLLIRVRGAVRMKNLSDRLRRLEEESADKDRELIRKDQELVALNKLVKNSADTDTLTRLSNHSFFMEELKEVMAISKHEPVEFSLLLIDVDNFSRINETIGYTTGDSALKSIASVLREHIREADLAARYRSDEFAVILYGCNLENSSKISEELRKKVTAKRLFSKGNHYHVTVSVGIAEYDHTTMKSPLDIIVRAAKALTEARRQGGNRVSHAY